MLSELVFIPADAVMLSRLLRYFLLVKANFHRQEYSKGALSIAYT